MTSLAVEERARYSASAELREIVFRFLAFQETKESPMKMQKPVTERRVSKQEPQLASENALRRTRKEALEKAWIVGDEAEEKRSPRPGLDFKYLSK